MIMQKVWGTTQPLVQKQNFEVHRIFINAGGYCSKHYHEGKYNAFFVEYGDLKIHVWNEDSNTVDITELKDGDQTAVAPKKVHMFEAVAPTVAYEIYWTEIGEDIVRQTFGGIKNIP